MAIPILEEIRSNARRSFKALRRTPRIMLGDAFDRRILESARIATDLEMANITLIGDRVAIEREAFRAGISLEGIEILSPNHFPDFDAIAISYFDRRSAKLLSLQHAEEELRANELLFGAALAGAGYADGMVVGSVSTTAEVIRAALKGIGLADGVTTLSSMFLLAFAPVSGIREDSFTLAFADAAVLVDPNAEQLADVAISTANTYRTLTGNEARVAMLSFSTHGSAQSPSTEKMIMATTLAREKAPDLVIDGELQFDAAFVPEVAMRKAKDSTVAGRANVFIFPNLDAGNISYKIAERLGMGKAIGPVLQGLRRPMNDLSRGATVSDIVNMIAITLLQGVLP